ncbi:hypothetical protein [Roseovarius sp. D0-M9]|uniref:hypothetical protein n=1 Tax=Roseovarius sp. D0-M9 TaxID=3127117 RepID=UPI00300FFE30
MTQNTNDSMHYYFVTAKTGDAQDGLDDRINALAAACARATGDPAPKVIALACLPGFVAAVVLTRDWPGARRYRRATFAWRGIAQGLTAYRLASSVEVQERIDFCHFAPVAHGLVSAPGEWRESTIHRSVRSEMILT